MRLLPILLCVLLLTGGAVMAQAQKTPPQAPGRAAVSEDARIPEDVWLRMLRDMEQFAKGPRHQKPEPEIVPDPANSRPLKKIEPRADELPERGLDHQRVKWVGEVLDEQGNRRLVTNSYIQLETGLNHHDAKGELVLSEPNFELTADGAIAWKGRHRVSLTGSPHGAGAVQIRMADNRLLVGNVAGLAYYDAVSGESVMIAEVRKAEGWLTNPNQVTYIDAFDGVQADLRYTSSRSGLEQDVILRETPPDPRLFGLDPATVRLEVWTEFTDAPEPKLTKRSRARNAGSVPPPEADDEDETIDFTGMRIGEGRAFSTGTETRPGNVPVMKRWLRTKEDRVFLIEAVEHSVVRSDLERLSKRGALHPRPTKRGIPRMQALMAVPRRARVESAQAAIRRPTPEQSVAFDGTAGFVLDYVATSPGYLTDFTFRGDTTYLVSGYTQFYGTTTLEGGAVIKYLKWVAWGIDPRTDVFGAFVSKTSRYRPAVFCAADDNSIGEVISGSTGNPGTAQYANIPMRFYDTPATKVENVRVLNAHTGISFHSSDSNSIVNVQLINCRWPVENSGYGALGCYNVLIQDVPSSGTEKAFNCWNSPVASIFGEHVTVRNAPALRYVCNLTLKNSLVVQVTDTSGLVNGGGTVVLPSDSGVFQPAWGGQNYLADGSPYRNAGVTDIAADLAVGFREMTTYPPQVLTGSLAVGTVLAPVVARDVDMPDLGYHYPALDYLLSGSIVQGGTVTLTNGVGIGFNGSCAFDLREAGALVSEGRPDRLNRILRHQLVQERSVAGEATADAVFNANTAVTTKASLSLRFTEVNTLSWADASSTLDPTRGRLELIKTTPTSLGSLALPLQS